jgi:hypothetical protein
MDSEARKEECVKASLASMERIVEEADASLRLLNDCCLPFEIEWRGLDNVEECLRNTRREAACVISHLSRVLGR